MAELDMEEQKCRGCPKHLCEELGGSDSSETDAHA